MTKSFYLYAGGSQTTDTQRFTVTGNGYNLSGSLSVHETTTSYVSYVIDLSYSFDIAHNGSTPDHIYAFSGAVNNLASVITVGSTGSATLLSRECVVVFGGREYACRPNNSFQVSTIGSAGNAGTVIVRDRFLCNVTASSTGGCNFTLGCKFDSVSLTVYDFGSISDNGSVVGAINQGTAVEQEGNEIAQEGNELQKEQNETTKGIFDKISDFFGSFFENIINSFKSLFIPEDDYFSDFFQRLNDFFADRLGMLYAPIDLFIRFLTAIQNAGGGDTGIPFPGVSWDGVYIIEPQTISLTSIAGDFPGLQDKIYFVTDVMMVGAVLWLLQNKLREVMQN